MYLKYLKKEVRDEVDFLHADKHQSFLQVNFNTLGIKGSYNIKYDQQNFTLVIKYFRTLATFVFCCKTKHSDILHGPNHVRC